MKRLESTGFPVIFCLSTRSTKPWKSLRKAVAQEFDYRKLKSVLYDYLLVVAWLREWFQKPVGDEAHTGGIPLPPASEQ